MYLTRYVVITKNSVRVYETKAKALSQYGKPVIAIPLAAVRKVERTKFDMTDLPMVDSDKDEQTVLLNQN